MTMTRPEITGVPGVPETALAEDLVARLPENLAPAPWENVVERLLTEDLWRDYPGRQVF